MLNAFHAADYAHCLGAPRHKGVHLKGNEDTAYKKELLETLEGAYENALERGDLHINERRGAHFRMMFEDNWKEDLDPLLSADD